MATPATASVSHDAESAHRASRGRCSSNGNTPDSLAVYPWGCDVIRCWQSWVRIRITRAAASSIHHHCMALLASEGAPETTARARQPHAGRGAETTNQPMQSIILPAPIFHSIQYGARCFRSGPRVSAPLLPFRHHNRKIYPSL